MNYNLDTSKCQNNKQIRIQQQYVFSLNEEIIKKVTNFYYNLKNNTITLKDINDLCENLKFFIPKLQQFNNQNKEYNEQYSREYNDNLFYLNYLENNYKDIEEINEKNTIQSTVNEINEKNTIQSTVNEIKEIMKLKNINLNIINTFPELKNIYCITKLLENWKKSRISQNEANKENNFQEALHKIKSIYERKQKYQEIQIIKNRINYYLNYENYQIEEDSNQLCKQFTKYQYTIYDMNRTIEERRKFKENFPFKESSEKENSLLIQK